jgi:hypothetical protein
MKMLPFRSTSRGLRFCCLGAFVWFGASLVAQAQFNAGWIQDEAYWGDGKAEFNLYDAQEVRYGQPRPSEVIHILVREPFSQRELVKAESATPANSYPVLKLNQILHIPTGLYVYQQMHSAFWRVESGALIKATLTSNDSCGNTYKEFRALSGLDTLLGSGWLYEWRTYWEGMTAGDEKVRPTGDAFFYDELPMRVRTIDFSAAQGEFKINLGPTVIRSKKEPMDFLAAQVTWKVEPESIRVSVKTSLGTEAFLLDPKPPHLLREWRKGDGSILKLRRSLKIDYWNYNKLGDKERALNP